ncbi:MAG TPA: hypothetical protein VK508_02075 [Cyclobacteriaceae bacterium]|nr:hypothetical protein [Cyclobacteriaceae bacterium]
MKYKIALFNLLLAACIMYPMQSSAQKKGLKVDNAPVYVDKQGVMRWKSNNAEASFFGVNYTTPFAYAYRAHKALNIDLEKAIQQDVYHLARLGLDAFRVHVWDNEISDVAGNLIENDHLRLFDFLLAELKKRNIKTIVTPIAFWGNGYPERDEAVAGFSQHFGRGKLTTNDSAVAAQENYLKQFFRHVNPYTKMTYLDDPDVIAVEINNEPSHSGPKPGVTAYINRLAAAIKTTGWNKPVFYNISQGPYYADAVAASVVDGYSFQWYPSGLVSGNTLKGNHLPHVDKYTIPFDTIPGFSKKALMVYEFDAADVLQSCMYPAMARAFREAGFQWATQFAYDPMNIAYGNTEYQTHYLNLAYTPSKAISMLVASRVFHKVPRRKNYGSYPADSVFDAFRLSYRASLSEMNTESEFYYSNTTSSKPLNTAKLQHVAGVGSSEVVTYEGSGAYFLDKLENGVWRLEVMPDAIFIRDPFEKASPKKEVVRIQWQPNTIKIGLNDLGNDFNVKGLNEGNAASQRSSPSGMKISPGTYLLTASGKEYQANKNSSGPIGLNEFVAPQPFGNDMRLFHEPLTEVTAGTSFTVTAKVVGLDSGKLSLQVGTMGGQSRNIPMKMRSSNEYTAEVPAELVTPGMLNYKMIMRKGKETVSFPGNIKDPQAWDNITEESWTTRVAGEKSALALFTPGKDDKISNYPTWRRGFQTSYVSGDRPGQMILKMTSNDMTGVPAMGFQYSFVHKLRGRSSELGTFDRLVIRARATGAPAVKGKIVVTCADAFSAAATVDLTNEFQDIEIPISSFAPAECILMPRPYPGFLPLTFKATGSRSQIDVATAERIEVTIGSEIAPTDKKNPYTLEVEYIWLQKRKKGL